MRETAHTNIQKNFLLPSQTKYGQRRRQTYMPTRRQGMCVQIFFPSLIYAAAAAMPRQHESVTAEWTYKSGSQASTALRSRASSPSKSPAANNEVLPAAGASVGTSAVVAGAAAAVVPLALSRLSFSWSWPCKEKDLSLSRLKPWFVPPTSRSATLRVSNSSRSRC